MVPISRKDGIDFHDNFKRLCFGKCPYGIPHACSPQLSTMKALKAVCWRMSPWNPSFLRPSALNNEGLKGCVLTNVPKESFIFCGLQLSPMKVLKAVFFAKSPYGIPNFYGLEFSTMKVLRAVFLANVPMESFIFIYVVLKAVF